MKSEIAQSKRMAQTLREQRPVLERSLASLQPGDHLCCIYSTEDEHRALFTPYLRHGLEQGERVLYITDAHSAETVLGYLRDVGLDVDAFQRRGQLAVLTYLETYLRDGVFSPHAMIGLLRAQTEKAMAEGYSALRVTGEMTWALRGLPGSEKLIEYEARLNEFFPGSRCLGMCQYDSRRCSAEVLLNVLRTHPLVAVGKEIYDNFYCVPATRLTNGNLDTATLDCWLESLATRKQAEAALLREKEFTESLTRSMSGVFYLFDSTGKALRWNRNVETVSEYSAEEIGQMSVLDFIAEEDRPLVAQRIQEVLEKGTSQAEGQLLSKSGKKTPYLFTGVRVMVDNKPCVVGVGLDITDRKRIEQALQFTRFSLDSAGDLMVCVDRDARYVDVNDALCRSSGYSREELLSMSVHDIDPDYSAEIWPEFWEKLKHSGSLTFESCHRTKEGKVYPVEIVATFFEYNGKEYHSGVARDITERKRAEQRMRTFSREIIAAREEERKQVASTLHHDVGSLAVGISAHLDAIEDGLRSGKSGEALKWTKRTRKLFDESVVRLKGVAVQLRPPELDVLGLRGALRQYFSQVTKHRGTRIHFRETLGRRRVSGDTATILFRVAQEALTNAIKHGHARRVYVGLSARKGEVTLTVRDNGKGFDPAKQGARATSQIGLRVMREMAVSAGGTFTIDSGRGKGTTMRVRLPFETAASGRRAVTEREETVARGKTLRSAGRGSQPQKGSRA